MILVGNILIGFGNLFSALITIVIWLFIIRALISWVNPDPYNPIVRFIYDSTEPLLKMVRRYIPNIGMFDVSIIIVILLLTLINYIVVQSLIDYGSSIKISSLRG